MFFPKFRKQNQLQELWEDKVCEQIICSASSTLVINSNQETKKGDWNCSSCSFQNFASRTNCKNCGKIKAAEKIICSASSTPVINSNQETKKGDWNCSLCSFQNFSSRTNCKNCGKIKSAEQITHNAPSTPVINSNQETKEGDWNGGSVKESQPLTPKNCFESKQHQFNSLSSVQIFDDLNHKNISNFFVQECTSLNKLRDIFSEQLISTYKTLSHMSELSDTSKAAERLHLTIKSNSNCLNDCRKVAEAAMGDVHFLLFDQRPQGMLNDIIASFKEKILLFPRGVVRELCFSVISYVNLAKQLGNQDSHFSIVSPNLIDIFLSFRESLNCAIFSFAFVTSK